MKCHKEKSQKRLIFYSFLNGFCDVFAEIETALSRTEMRLRPTCQQVICQMKAFESKPGKISAAKGSSFQKETKL